MINTLQENIKNILVITADGLQLQQIADTATVFITNLKLAGSNQNSTTQFFIAQIFQG